MEHLMRIGNPYTQSIRLQIRMDEVTNSRWRGFVIRTRMPEIQMMNPNRV